MSVIGRLDGQVDAVLIEPLAKKNRPPAAIHNTQPNADNARPRTETNTASESESSKNNQAEHPELPVWLL